MRSPVSTPRKLPTLSEVAPTWAGATVRLLELRTQEEELLAEAARERPDWLFAVTSSGPGSFPAVARRDRPEPDKLTPAAKALLGDEFTPPPPPASRPVDLTRESPIDAGDPAAQRRADLHVRLEGVRQAIDVMQTVLRREHLAGSRALCDAVRSDYAQHAAAVCTALVSLANAFRAHESFVAEVVAGGGSPLFLPLLNVEYSGLRGFVGNPRSARDSPLRGVLASAAEAGYYDAGAAIAEWSAPAPPAHPAPFADAVAALHAAAASRENAPKAERKRKSLMQRIRGDGMRLPPIEATILPGSGSR